MIYQEPKEQRRTNNATLETAQQADLKDKASH